MHELALAMSIISLVENEVARRGADNVSVIELKIGNQTCVDFGCFVFALDAALVYSRYPMARIKYIRAVGSDFRVVAITCIYNKKIKR